MEYGRVSTFVVKRTWWYTKNNVYSPYIVNNNQLFCLDEHCNGITVDEIKYYLMMSPCRRRWKRYTSLNNKKKVINIVFFQIFPEERLILCIFQHLTTITANLMTARPP